MDSTLLSKIENGRRLPTAAQVAALAKFLKVPPAPLERQRLAEEMIKRYADHPEFEAAAAIVREQAGEYGANNLSARVSKSAKAVNKSKKKA